MNYSNEFKNFLDLTYDLSAETPCFPRWWHKNNSFEILGTIEVVGRNTSHISVGTHSGTHLDAPSHFIADGESIHELAVYKFIGHEIGRAHV